MTADEHPKMEEEMKEEMEAISDLDPTSPKMALGHSHQTYRTVELRKFTASRQDMRLRRPPRNGTHAVGYLGRR